MVHFISASVIGITFMLGEFLEDESFRSEITSPFPVC